MVFVTSLVHNIDPITIIFRQEEMRAHYTQCLEQGKIESFPVKKPPGTQNPITEKIHIYSCPSCYRDDGTTVPVWFNVTNATFGILRHA